ncbi:hypothetical protein DTO166G4_2694 [Paecilomyces variotii]|nr:hypothetical protein DTO032I3_7687 [Paecilomyces variotii]KAJ9215588.1 hypothetical protein DTO166G4_2694 [Paecilomyces variotii]KAJ9232813.1 hypothetical protein DTO166G5_6014 [Paecilomyces variotii]KAJ9247650.1 hypothetical protein DTO195F2_9071 [Paecilomyces variotii]KAJ9276217.1 hypothetical protein DTO021D3_6848 [Paecilomyces variotii]
MFSRDSTLLPPPETINNTHKVYSVAIACIVLGIISSGCVILRLMQRLSTRSFGPDDYAIIPGLMLYIGWTAMAAYVNLHAGVGKPLWEITVGEFSVWFKGIIGSAWIYPAMSMSIRTSILLTYDRIFAKSMPTVRFIIRFLLSLQVIYLIVYSILPAFICRPLNKAWHPLERQQYFNDWYYYYLQVALYSTSMAFDVILLVLPLYPISQLQMALRKRIGIGSILVLGACAGIAAAYKLGIFVQQMTRYTDINPRWSQYEMSQLIPPQFDKYGNTFWIPSQVEPSVALIGTSLPAMRQFVVRMREKEEESKGRLRIGDSDPYDLRRVHSKVPLRTENLDISSNTVA